MKKYIYAICVPICIIVSIPIGLLTGIIGITVGLIEDTLHSINREWIEHHNQPDWKRESFIRYYLSRHHYMSDLLSNEKQIPEQNFTLPNPWISISSQIIINIILYPLLIAWVCWNGPFRTFRRLHRFTIRGLNLQQA